MKKILAAVLALVMILSFAACSENGETSTTEVITVTAERGTVEAGVYKNSTFGITFAAEEDWYFLSDAEIAQAMGVAAEEVYGEGTVIEGDHIYDLYCVDTESNATVSINYENLGAVAEFGDANSYLETVMTELISTGAENGVVDAIITNIKINGIQVPCLNIVLNYSGTTIYEKIIVKQVGSWMSSITLASLSETEIEELVERITLE